MRHLLALLGCLMALGAADAAAQSHNITTVAGTGGGGYDGDNGPAGQALVGAPVGVEVLPDGGYLIFQHSVDVVRRVLPNGTITTIAGSGTAGYTGDGGPATDATMSAPSGGARTADGGYLIADANNNAIRRVSPGGTITTVVGNGSASFSGDGGPASAATIRFPYDVAVQADGGYLIADTDNHRIRRVSPGGTITTVAGGGATGLGDGGPATSAALNKPSGVAVTGDGGFLIADTFNNRVRKVAFDGTITTVAGGGTGGLGDDGPATAAQLSNPVRVAVDHDGGFVIADQSNHRLRKVAPDGTITTIAGTSIGYSGDGGPATSAQLNTPFGADVTASGDYLIADTNNNRVRLVDAVPPAPQLTGTSPQSPADQNAPRILGNAPPGTTVRLYATGACSGTPAASASAAELSAPGITVLVPDNSTTTFHATATDAAGNASACSPTSVTYVEQSAAAPSPPVLTGSSPASPADDNTPRIRGTAPPGTTVDLFANDTCTGAPAASGSAAELAAPGIAVSVADNTVNTFRASARPSGGGASSGCSSSTVVYVESSLPEPVRGRVVNAVPEKGTVLVKLPARRRSGKAGATAAASFVPLEQIGRQLPVGSTLDTRKGTVRLTSAANTRRTQEGHFSRGLFTIGQTRKNPLTTLSMRGGGLDACSALPRGGARKPGARPAATRQRRLFSRARGRYRTRGRNSVATVRGTTWTMTDTCRGTRTSVRQGSVSVQNLHLRKKRPVVVRAGQSYLVKSRKRKRRR